LKIWKKSDGEIMDIKILEKDNEKAKLEINDLTFVNLLNERIWQQKIDYSAYAVDHPYLSKPILTIKGKNIKKILTDATQSIIKDAETGLKMIK